MDVLLNILLFVVFPFIFAYGLFLAAFRGGRRKYGLKMSGGALLCFAVAVVFFADADARSDGFESVSDKANAKQAGVTDAAVWATKKAEAQKVAEAEQLAKDAESKEAGFHCLSVWDGHHSGLIAMLQPTLRDPDSFEAIETKITPVIGDTGKHLLAMKYRAKNGFGGYALGEITANIDHETCGVEIIGSVSE